MFRFFPILVFLPAFFGPAAWAQPVNRTHSARVNKDTKESFLGLYFNSIPEVLYAHLARLPRKQGILVDQVKPDSAGQQSGLKRHDILLNFNGQEIKNVEQFRTMLQNTKAERKAPLVVIRNGKEITLEVSLANAYRVSGNDNNKYSRANLKYGRPPAVSMKATPLGNGKLEVTLEYFPEGTGKLKRNTYSGSLDQIEAQVRHLPMPVQDLARVALERLRVQSKKR
jgi:membrane-associated protease RseP (regulator of RpoE activity)